MAEPKSLIDRIGDALKGEKEATGKAAEPARSLPDRVEEQARRAEQELERRADEAGRAARTMPDRVEEEARRAERQIQSRAEEVKQVIAKPAENWQQELGDLRSKLTEKERELVQKSGLLGQRERELQQKERTLADQVAALAKKDQEIAALQVELKQAQSELAQAREELLAGARAVTAAVPARTYKVKSGDSLSAIAQAMYGNAARWPEIFEANKDKIKDPRLIRPGQELRIP